MHTHMRYNIIIYKNDKKAHFEKRRQKAANQILNIINFYNAFTDISFLY